MLDHDLEEGGDRGRTSKAMQGARPLPRGTLVLAIAVVLLVGFVGGGLAGYVSRGLLPAPAVPGQEYLFLTIGFDFATGLDRYFPANFTVPTHTSVLVTITNYDNASNPVPTAVASVQGTVGNVETMQAASSAVGMVMGAVPAGDVAHTFTMDSGGYAINVPIPAANSLADPMVVTFHAYFNITGTFDWHCLAPCDASSMTTPGYMRGTVTVVET
jgi:hypothetical protein